MKHLLRQILLITTLGLGSVFHSCNSDNPVADTGTKSSDNPKFSYALYSVNVDHLRLREKPGLNSGIITKLSEGQIVAGTGNFSKERDTVELRGVKYLAPYYQLSVADSSNTTGWAYGGALTCLYKGSEEQRPDVARLSALNTFLKKQEINKPDSGKKAWEYVESEFSETDRSTADAAFILLRQYFLRMEDEGELYKFTEKIPFKKEDIQAILDGNFEMSAFPQTAALANAGFRLTTGEGMIFPVADLRRFQDFFSPRATPAMQKYINQRTSEQNTPMVNDGTLMIPINLVADLTIFWEQFNRSNPDFPLLDETKASVHWLQEILICGTDNTPSFDYNTQEAAKNYRTVWAYLQGEFSGYETGQLARKMNEIGEAAGWKRSNDVDAFMTSVRQKAALQ